MKIAIGSDMSTHLTDRVIEAIAERGHEVRLFGALAAPEALWAKVAVEVAEEVASGRADQAVLFCWTGTGISLAANKVRGIRAALCSDPETAAGARKWNDANILAMSLRNMSEHLALEILDKWFETVPSTDPEDRASLDFLARYENRDRMK